MEADDAPPVAKIPSTDTIGFEFSSSPREKSAYLIDYDADSYEISQLNKVDENRLRIHKLLWSKNIRS